MQDPASKLAAVVDASKKATKTKLKIRKSPGSSIDIFKENISTIYHLLTFAEDEVLQVSFIASPLLYNILALRTQIGNTCGLIYFQKATHITPSATDLPCNYTSREAC